MTQNESFFQAGAIYASKAEELMARTPPAIQTAAIMAAIANTNMRAATVLQLDSIIGALERIANALEEANTNDS